MPGEPVENLVDGGSQCQPIVALAATGSAFGYQPEKQNWSMLFRRHTQSEFNRRVQRVAFQHRS